MVRRWARYAIDTRGLANRPSSSFWSGEFPPQLIRLCGDGGQTGNNTGGGVGGGEIGYNYRFGSSIVIGAEARITGGHQAPVVAKY